MLIITLHPPDYPDEDTTPNDARVNSDELGTICVRIFLVKNLRRRGNSFSKDYGIRDHPPAVIGERTKKATEHCTSLGNEKPRAAHGWYTVTYDSQEPVLVFEFRYRSLPMLQALGIIPGPKREAPLIIDLEDEDTLPPPKRRKAVHNNDLIQSMQAELDRLWRKVGEYEGEQAGPSGIKKEMVKYDPDDIIDLT